MATLTVTPLPAPVGSVVTIAGSSFANLKTRLTLDGAGSTTNVFRPAKDGTFRVGITVATTARSQTLVAEQYSGGKWKMVARLAPLLTFLPPSGADTTPPVITAQQIINITSTSVDVSWTTNEPSTSQVDYGTTTGYALGPTTLNSTLLTTHTVTVTGLTASTLYHFRVRSKDGATNEVVGTDMSGTTFAGGVTDTTAPVITGPTATAQSATSYLISWSLDEPATGQVQYGLTTAYGLFSTKESSFAYSAHNQVLSSLTLGATYHYRVISTDASGNTATSDDATFVVADVVGSVVTLTASNTKAEFITKTADMTIDVIELSNANGNFKWQDVQIDADRTARPLTIRPKLGHTVIFDGSLSISGRLMVVGQNSRAKYITFDGRPGGVGTTSGMWFRDLTLYQSGVFEVQGTDYCTFKYLTFANNRRDGIIGDTPYKQWDFYISAAGSGSNDHLLLDHNWHKAPLVYRDGGGLACPGSSGNHGTITVSNVQEMTGRYYALYASANVTNLVLDTWTMTDCGDGTGEDSIHGASTFNVNCTYSNIHATGSGPIGNSGTGTFTNGGGNSGI